jgi:AcrR family transcriptional regulator
MTEQSTDTKNKIMEAARVLFADHGFEGTSVREIARAAEVNVAAVNYHFSNKENLFTEILHTGYVQCSHEMRTMYEKENLSLENTLLRLFQYFTNKSHDLISFFKMAMSSQHSHHLTSQGTEDEFFGPPGGKVLADAILKEVGRPVSDEDLHWALRSLFTHVVHNSIMYHCCFKNNEIPFTELSDLEAGIVRLARVVLAELKHSPHSASNP